MTLFSADAATPGVPYWWEHGAALPELSNRLPPQTDLLIVGAGYTGLSAAITAHDAGANVVVVDAEIPGQGASTRNGGMFGAHPRLGYSALTKTLGESVATGIFNEARAAFEHTASLIKQENIDCHFEQCGRIQMAWTQAHFATQRKQVAELLATTNMHVELVEPDELNAEINTARYFGAIRFPDHASLHPRQFHDGLMHAVLNRGIQVVQQCVIESVQQQATGFVARDSNGHSLQAEKVIMATNGYTRGRFGWFQRRVFPLPSFLVATEPLSHNLIDYLAPGRRMMVETRARHSYFRVSPDGNRFVFGGRASMRPIAPEVAAKRLFDTMIEVWPELADVKLTHSWLGNTGYAFTHMPQIGTHNGLYFSMGYSGSGVAMAPYLGAKVAWLALGDERGHSAYQAANLTTRSIHPIARPLFLHGASLWFDNVVDRRDSREARRDRHRRK